MTRSIRSPVAQGPLNALSIDVEDYFHVHAFESVIDRNSWQGRVTRVVSNTRRVLRLLARHKTRATFFILGWVADRHPQLVREIAAGGHEIATHGYAHEFVYRQTPQGFRDDLRRSLDAIAGAASSFDPALRSSIWGYRAPSFSITPESWWAFDILVELGLRYDSSMFPLVAHDRYGIRQAPRFANRMSNGLWEFPVSTWRLFGLNLPVGGGGYFRLLPLCLTNYAIKQINAEGSGAVLYLHSWEFDPDQPRIRRAPMLSRFRHYVNLGRTEQKLSQLLSGGLQFAPMREALAKQLGGDGCGLP